MTAGNTSVALIDNSHRKTNKCTNVKIIYFLNTICHNSDMFRSILIVQRELLNINKAYKNMDWLLNTLKFVHKMFVDIIKFVCSSAEMIHKMWRL